MQLPADNWAALQAPCGVPSPCPMLCQLGPDPPSFGALCQPVKKGPCPPGRGSTDGGSSSGHLSSARLTQGGGRPRPWAGLAKRRNVTFLFRRPHQGAESGREPTSIPVPSLVQLPSRLTRKISLPPSHVRSNFPRKQGRGDVGGGRIVTESGISHISFLGGPLLPHSL